MPDFGVMRFSDRRGRSGQAMIFLVMILIIMVFIVLWNFDLHKVLFAKSLSQNAGDAAALAAGRWQAISLNVIGELNILEAVAAMETLAGRGDRDAPRAISELQARLCYAGPMIGMMAAQQAAKSNRIHNNDEFTAYLKAHAAVIRSAYPQFITESYTNCLQDYADMLDVLCADGIAAGPDNMQLYTDYIGDHMLLNVDFYDAISARAWCWFFFNAYDLLRNYRGHEDWPPLPPISNPFPINCEFFSLQLHRAAVYAGSAAVDAMNELKRERNLPGSALESSQIAGMPIVFYSYGRPWYAAFPMSNADFPAAGPVRSQYNCAGADSAIRIVANDITLRTPGATIADVTWSAAAKPFGHLNGELPTVSGIVLPVFHDVRLIPLDASSAPAGGGFNLQWRRHVEEHLIGYITGGPSRLNGGCWYCAQLATWEDAGFRQQGAAWLSVNSRLCYSSGGGGGPPGGGARRGH
jgi:hypothetical protein